MSVSPTRQARKSKTRNRSEKSAKQGWVKRMLRLEALEQRQLMAADIMPFHNSLVAADVNGDFSISPLDALVVINRLNAQGSGPLAGQAPTDANSFVDSDNDNSLSPLDALVVINAINNGEGVGELAQIRYKFFSVNADGTAGAELADPNPNDLIPEATIGTGDRVIVRTQMLDLRSMPQGVFSAYHDLSYTNADGTAAEKLEFQWGEYNQIDIGNAVRGGTFTIKFGTETTGPISPAFFQGGGGTLIYDGDGTAVNIRNALQALPSVGAGNVSVRLLNSSTTSRFGINFIGRLAHMDLPNSLQVGTNS
ncbi:MAG TPA: dockerin type I domain-containing protein, partial [Pirellula sp.]|nr:dockerin type I domain-containing protein [Pirellula sp.]